MVRARVYLLWLAQNAIFVPSAVVNITELLTIEMLAQSLKHAFKSPPTVRAPVYSLLLAQSAIFAHRESNTKRDICTVSNRESIKTADSGNVGAIIKTRIQKVSYGAFMDVLSMQSLIFARSAVVNMTELLTIQMLPQSLKPAFKSPPTVRARVYSL